MDTKVPLYVVRISGQTSTKPKQIVNGTGFLASQQGHVVTCRHVVIPGSDGKPLEHLQVHLPFPPFEKPCSYQIRETSSEDLAVLESSVPLAFPTPQAMLSLDWKLHSQIGEPVTVWGHSATEHYSSPLRIDCVISGFSEQNGRIGLQGNINSGDSGAPVLNKDQRVIGIAQVRDAKRDGQAMAIPISLLQPLLSKMGNWRPTSAVQSGPVFLAPMPPLDHSIIGREAIIKQLKQHLTPGGHVVLYFKPGVGKSALAIALANDPEVRARFPDGVLWADLNRRPNILTVLKTWGKALGFAHETMTQLNTLPVPEMPISGMQRLEGNDLTRIVEEQWATALTNEIGERSLLLVLDDAWEYEPAKALALNAPNCAHLITTRQPVKVAKRFGKSFYTKMVEELSDEDGMELMRQLAPAAVSLFPEEVREVVHAVGGLPQGLLLLGTYLGQVSYSGRPRRIKAAIANIHENLHEYIKPLDAAIKISYDALSNDEARRALQVLSTFRPKPNTFSEEAALALLDGGEGMLEVLDILDDSGLIETVQRAELSDSPPYTMHRTIVEFVRMQLSETDIHKLHRRAADYFRHWLQHYDEDERRPGDYLFQYRYEEPEWQIAMDDYLYHLGRSGDLMAATVSFAEIYFNAFWWWGCFLDFPFCTRLLKQASLKRLSPEAQSTLKLLCDFDASYPKESQRTSAEGWSKVETILLEIRRVAQLEGETASLTAEQQHLRAVTDIFLAEAMRFGRMDAERAAHWYSDANALLADDDWSKPWVLYHLSDLYLETDALDLAEDNCHLALALAAADGIPAKERDNEVLANIYRVLAEADIKRHLVSKSIRNYNLAALYAYAFQAIPSPPDPYTLEFYQMMTQRIVEGVSRAYDHNPQQGVWLCHAMQNFWTNYRRTSSIAAPNLNDHELEGLLKDGQLNRLVRLIFPPPPGLSDLNVAGSDYYNNVITVFNEKHLTSSSPSARAECRLRGKGKDSSW